MTYCIYCNCKSFCTTDNGLTDSDAEMLCEPIAEHSVLRVLNLNRNEFGSSSGAVFKKILGYPLVITFKQIAASHIILLKSPRESFFFYIVFFTV